MEIVAKAGKEELAIVYLARKDDEHVIEFVESLQPPVPRDRKWVLILSTMFGCPVRCTFCDAGGFYRGKLSEDEIIFQIDHMVTRRFPDRKVPIPKFKIQFARVGEPSLNNKVINVLQDMPRIYDAPGMMVCISSIEPCGTEDFFDDLISVKKKYYSGKFQLQFSIHTTDYALRDYLMPIKKWDFEEIASYGHAFHEPGDRKIALNFALAQGFPVDPAILSKYFSPDEFLIKITPMNPTVQAGQNRIQTSILPGQNEHPLAHALEKAGYEVIMSIGEWEENKIGSNCGQYITHYLKSKQKISNGYTYPLLSPTTPGEK